MNHSNPAVQAALRDGFEILYRDHWIVAIEKPSGLLSHPTSWCPGEPGCLQLLRDQLGRLLYPVHRLDRSTSGIMLFALDADTAGSLGAMFRESAVRKRYLAVVRGYVDARGTLDEALSRRDGRGYREARTDYSRYATVELHAPVGRYTTARYSLVFAEPLTGRTHQIRRHFSHIAHPIIGDTKHGDRDHNRFFRETFDLDRLMLFATDIAFKHPATGRSLRLRAPVRGHAAAILRSFGWYLPDRVNEPGATLAAKDAVTLPAYG